MLRKVLFSISRRIKKAMMAENVVAQHATGEECGEKRQLKDEETSCPPAKKLKVQQNAPMQGRTDRKRKVALLIAYCGAGYYGIQIQRNGNFKTIESELIQALVKAELIPQEHADTPQKMGFQRAARTDKNVSAIGNVLSLKMLYAEGVEDKINAHLPAEIRVIGCVRTTQGFDSKNHCTARTYKYMLPTYSFAPVEKFITKDYRLPEGSLKKVNEILSKYVGTHNFHNFTSGRKPNDPSSKRYIISFESGEPFVQKEMEFVILTVKGQSFMLHHIRKMIGLMIAIVRGFCGEDVLEKSWGPYKMDIPKVPGLGLFLNELFFAGYNKKFGKDGIHEPLVWDKYQETLEKFKEEYVLSHIASTEVKESVMLQWLGTLQFHKFDVIDPTQEVPPDGENEKDPSWWSTKAFLKRLDRAQKAPSMAVSTDQEGTAAMTGDPAPSCPEQEKPCTTYGQQEQTQPEDPAPSCPEQEKPCTTYGQQDQTQLEDPAPSCTEQEKTSTYGQEQTQPEDPATSGNTASTPEEVTPVLLEDSAVSSMVSERSSSIEAVKSSVGAE